MNPRLLKISAILSSLLLAAGFIYYRTSNSILADEPNGTQPATKPRTLLPGSKAALMPAPVTPAPTSAAPPTTQPPATAPTPEQIELQRRLLIMSSSKSAGIVSPEDLSRHQAQLNAQQKAQQQQAQQNSSRAQTIAPATMPESIP